MNKSITIVVKTVYGKEMVYPACSLSNEFAKIAGTKTLSDSVIKSIKNLGYTFNIKTNTIKGSLGETFGLIGE